MIVDYWFILLVYLAGAFGGIGFSYLLNRGFLGAKPTGFPPTTPPPMPVAPSHCRPYGIGPLDDCPVIPPNQPRPITERLKPKERPTYIRFMPGVAVDKWSLIDLLASTKGKVYFLAKRSFSEGIDCPNFGKDKIPEQYNG